MGFQRGFIENGLPKGIFHKNMFRVVPCPVLQRAAFIPCCSVSLNNVFMFFRFVLDHSLTCHIFSVSFRVVFSVSFHFISFWVQPCRKLGSECFLWIWRRGERGLEVETGVRHRIWIRIWWACNSTCGTCFAWAHIQMAMFMLEEKGLLSRKCSNQKGASGNRAPHPQDFFQIIDWLHTYVIIFWKYIDWWCIHKEFSQRGIVWSAHTMNSSKNQLPGGPHNVVLRCPCEIFWVNTESSWLISDPQ